MCGRRLVALAVIGSCAVLAASADEPAKELPLVFRDDFAKGTDAWEPTDVAAWKVVDAAGGKAFSLFKQSDYKPPHRSPFNFALVKDVVVGDFVFEAKVRSTTRDYPHRDAVVVFGHQDPAHFYYVHLGKKTDDHANQIFVVDGAPRTKISTKTTSGTDWTDGWHTVRIERTPNEGSIAVYFDDMKTPAMTATDKRYLWGRVGVGSFDDTTDWADVRLRGVKVAPKRSKP